MAINKLRSEGSADSQDMLQSGGWVQLPRRVRLGVIWGGIGGVLTMLVGVVTFAVSVQAEAKAATVAAQTAQRSADAGPARVLEVVGPRLRELEVDRDTARVERASTAREVSAVRLYLCRECERRRRAACDDICMRAR